MDRRWFFQGFSRGFHGDGIGHYAIEKLMEWYLEMNVDGLPGHSLPLLNSQPRALDDFSTRC
jgi:hypothetical protein